MKTLERYLMTLFIILVMLLLSCYKEKQPNYIVFITADSGSICVGEALWLRMNAFLELETDNIFGPFPIGRYEDVNWQSENESIAKLILPISANYAVVKGIQSGTTTIIAESPGLRASFELIVFDDTETQLTSGPGKRLYPQWSPDGATIAYSRDDQIFTVSANGGQELQLTFSRGEKENPQWSPGGLRIAYTSEILLGSRQVYSVPAGGGEEIQLTSGEYRKYSPQWSPDGSKIVYSIFTGGTDRGGEVSQIATVPATGGQEHILTHTLAYRGNPQWSPDGETIVYSYHSAPSPNDGSIRTVSAGGGSENSISPVFEAAEHPDWSPDGQAIVFESKSNLDRYLHIVQITDGNALQITPVDSWSADPQWSPDGRYIVFSDWFSGYGSTDEQIFVVPATGGIRYLSTCYRSESESHNPQWSPDGKKILFTRTTSEGSHICVVELGFLSMSVH